MTHAEIIAYARDSWEWGYRSYRANRSCAEAMGAALQAAKAGRVDWTPRMTIGFTYEFWQGWHCAQTTRPVPVRKAVA